MATSRDVGTRGGDSVAPISVVHVDDDDEFLSTTVAFLTSQYDDLHIESFTSPDAALARLDASDVDCVVSDYSMPEMNGLEFLATVRTEWTELPFVLYTGKGSEEIASDAIAAGVTEYVRKGAGTSHYDLLAKRIRDAVVAHRATRRAAALDHVASVIRQINQALLRADTHDSLFADATEMLAAADPYVAAWIGTREDGMLQTAAWQGPVAECPPFTEQSSALGTFVRQAFGSHGVHVRQIATDPIDVDAGFVPGSDYESIAAVPLRAAEEPVGVLVVFAIEAGAFDEAECDLLEEVAADIGFAVHAIRLREQLRQRAVELELLSRVLRHDIRNDIQIVLGWCALLAETTDDEQRTLVEKIETTSRHVIELTDSAREVVEAIVADGDTPLESIEVTPLLEAEIGKVREAFEDATFTLSNRTDDPRVMANEMLASVFRNVLNNAVQHHDSDEAQIDVTLTQADGRVVVKVADDGPGIPPERREQVFGKGERGFGSGGTGLGLYLVRTLVDIYGGTVTIEDGDSGAVVVIELPTV